MMAGRGTAVISIATEGHISAAKGFELAARRLNRVTLKEMRDVGDDAVIVMRGHAPKDTGAMAESIHANTRGRGGIIESRIVVQSDARGGGYAYLNVTRFGHRKERIRPVRARRLAVHFDGRDADPTLLPSVRGVRVTSDWVADVDQELRGRYARAERNIGQSVTGGIL